MYNIFYANMETWRLSDFFFILFSTTEGLKSLLSEYFISGVVGEPATIELHVTPMSPLYYDLCGTGPSGLCEVTAHTTCSGRVFAVASG